MSRTRTFDFEYNIPTDDGEEITLTVEAKVYAGSPAGSPEYRGGPPMQPPEDPFMEILSVETEDGDDYDASEEELKEMTEEAWNHIPDDERY